MSVNQILNYTLYGKTARVFPFPPNWDKPVIESLEWKTDVIRSYDGSEQRRQLRQVPRRSFEYSMMLSCEKAAMFEAYLWGWQHRDFALPVWTDVTRTVGTMNEGATGCTVESTSLLGFAVGHYALLYSDVKTFEVVSLIGVTENTLTFAAGTFYAWGSGVKVYPVVLGHLGGAVQTARHTSKVVTVGSIAFQTSGHNTYPNIPSIAAPVVYDGHEVYMSTPNWKDTITHDFSREFDTVDAGVGALGYYEHEKVTRIVKPFGWVLGNRAKINEFRGFMGRLAGQAKSCWMPSWNDDFTLAASTEVNTKHLMSVKGVWFNRFVGVDSSHDRLMITMPDGSTVFRRIVAMTPNYATDSTQIEFDTPLVSTISVGDNPKLRLLLRCRLATDKIVLPWVTDRVSNPQTTFATIKI